MNAKELADRINGIEYGRGYSRLMDVFAKEAKDAGLVIAVGESDDLLEFYGAIRDESGSYGGTIVAIDVDGILPSWESASEDEETTKRLFERKPNARAIEAVWCEEGSGYAWILKTDIQHEIFSVMEDGEGFSRGIVFALADLVPVPAEPKGAEFATVPDSTARIEFESWIQSQPFYAHCCGEVIERDDDETGEGYIDANIHGAWLAFRHLRESIEDLNARTLSADNIIKILLGRLGCEATITGTDVVEANEKHVDHAQTDDTFTLKLVDGANAQGAV